MVDPFIMHMTNTGVQVSLHVPQLIPRSAKVNNQVNTSVITSIRACGHSNSKAHRTFFCSFTIMSLSGGWQNKDYLPTFINLGRVLDVVSILMLCKQNFEYENDHTCWVKFLNIGLK